MTPKKQIIPCQKMVKIIFCLHGKSLRINLMLCTRFCDESHIAADSQRICLLEYKKKKEIKNYIDLQPF